MPRSIGSGASFVRIDFIDGMATRIHIGGAIWQSLQRLHNGNVTRVVVRRDRNQHASYVWLVPCVHPFGHSVSKSNSMPRLSIGVQKCIELGLVPGRFVAQLEYNDIRFDLAEPYKD